MSGGASGSNNQSTPQLTPQQFVSLYQQALPSTLATTVGQAPATTSTLANAAAGANPIYTQSGLNQLNTLAGGYQNAGANLANSQAQSTANLLAGPGANAAGAANNLVSQYDPTVASTNNQANNLVNSINLNGLSGGEQAATERSLNQSNYATGNLGLDNATNAVANAMNFGNALQAKRTALGSALNTATGVTTANNNVFNPVTTATNSGNTSTNFGLGTFNPTQANSTTGTATSFGTSLGNQLTGIGSSQTSSGSSSAANGGISCFLTTACCQYKGLPDDCEELTILRKFRDDCVPKKMVEEYYRLAPKMGPLLTEEILQKIYSVIKICVEYIKHNKRDQAIDLYSNLVNNLKITYGIR